MCQEGAQVLAKAGWDYRDILKHYYAGVTVEGTEQAAPVWYFAEGTTRPDFVTYFCLANPSDSRADVTLTYFLDDGQTVAKSHAVAPHARTTVDASKDVGAGRDFSCRVASMNGVGIIAERPMYYFEYGGWTGGHDAMGAPYPKTDWYFAEGTTRTGFATYYCIANPSEVSASVTVTYMHTDGFNQEAKYTVAPRSRMTIDASRDIGPGKDFSCRISSTNRTPIVAERPMYFSYGKGWTGGHDTMGTPYPKSDWFFAEGTARPGFVTYLCVQNTSDKAADVKIRYLKGDGTTAEQLLKVPAGSRSTIAANDFLGTAADASHDFALQVTCTNNAPIVVERPMYFSYGSGWTGGHDTMGR
jgi:hypothetical protein